MSSDARLFHRTHRTPLFLLLTFFIALPITVFALLQQQNITSKAAGTGISVTVFLHGIGKGGDSANAGSLGNMNPLTKQRTVSVGVFNAQNALVASKAFTVTYNATNGNYTGSADFGTLQSGSYTVVVRTDKYLQKVANGIQNITSGQTNYVTPVILIAGDMVVDNKIDIQDYNVLMNCYADLTPAKSCTPQQKSLTDITDDSYVNQLDYNLFIREISNRSGAGNPTTMPTVRVAPTTVLTQPASPTQASGTVLTPESFGAKCDGTTDDQSSLQRAFDALGPGKTLQIGAGKVCRHGGVLNATKAGMRVIGPGTLLATNPQAGAVYIKADNVTLEGGLIVKTQGANTRLSAPEQGGVSFAGTNGAVLRNITIDGSASAGIYNVGADNFLFENVTVQNPLSDCNHNTGGATNGIIRNSTSRNCGDDGFAIVSYKSDGQLSRDILIESPKFYGQTHGRAFSVVGGENITYKDVYGENSDAAAIYIGSEPSYNTYGVKNIKVLGGRLVGSNKNAGTGHGAILVYNGNGGTTNSDITIQDITIQNTRASAPWHVGITGNQPSSRIQFLRINISGSPSNLFGSSAPASSVNAMGWTYNGAAVADRKGF